MNISYEKSASLTKSDVLFIHGNLASTTWWEPTLNEWKKLGSLGGGEMIFADWRGCGKNEDWFNDRPFTLKDLAQDYFDLLDNQGKQKVTLVGHSLGGLIALQMMSMAPERIEKCVMLDPVGCKGVVFDDSMYEAFRQMAASRELTQMVVFSTIKDHNFEEKFVERIADDAFKAVKGIGASVLEILKTVDLSEEAKACRVPTLILHGAHDHIIPLKDSEHLHSLMPNAKLEVLPDAGHCWNVENPQAFVKRIRDWI